MKIKTIIKHDPISFDKEVNAMLKLGYEVLSAGPYFTGTSTTQRMCAVLIKNDKPKKSEPIDLMVAFDIVHSECGHYEDCGECPLFNVCHSAPPYMWNVDGVYSNE